MFEILRPRRSASSSLAVHHSSPMAVPTSTKEEPFHASGLPSGTVPNTPAPLQKALEMDSTSPSPAPSPAFETSARVEPALTPMPGTNLTLEDIHSNLILTSSSTKPLQEPPDYFDISHKHQYEVLLDYSNIPFDREAARRVSAEALRDFSESNQGMCAGIFEFQSITQRFPKLVPD